MYAPLCEFPHISACINYRDMVYSYGIYQNFKKDIFEHDRTISTIPRLRLEKDFFDSLKQFHEARLLLHVMSKLGFVFIFKLEIIQF